jgi:outer membrane protein assembly factor BamC
VTASFLLRPAVSAVLLALLAGCASVDNFLSGDKVDYRQGGVRTAPLEVPPDLTQLARDGRYQPAAGGSVSAAARQQQAAAAPAPGAAVPAAANAVSPVPSADLRIERAGDKRWLVTGLKPEQLWPQLTAFWKEQGFALAIEDAPAGVLETDWAENRAKIPNDGLRSLLGRVIDGLYSTGERDRFRTRIERTAAGSEVFITHRGMVEVYSSQLRDATAWQPRPADTELEAVFLARLMSRLGAKEEVAMAAVAAPAPTAPPRARMLAGGTAAGLEVDDGFDRAWRRVGVALDRSGFTVEDRDRAQGLYFVRYVDPNDAKRAEPGFFDRLFGRKDDGPAGPQRFRVLVKAAEGERSRVSVLNAQGAPDGGESARRIVGLLVDDLK